MSKSQVKDRANFEMVTISAKGATRVRSGHLWIYRSDLLNTPQIESGTLVRVIDEKGHFLALAYYGKESEISLRIISTSESEIDREFWRARLQAASTWRQRMMIESDAYRLVHAEGDYLPGLIIDRYGECFVIQTLTRGMDTLKKMWVDLIVEEFDPELIVERNDAKVRQLEGLPLINSVLFRTESRTSSSGSELAIVENGIKFVVDLIEGQKTGAFLDQRENRAAAMHYAKGRGLDCFSFHGSFALHLAKNCSHVVALDISRPAIERARANAQLNGLSNVELIEANVFDQLREYDDRGERFETIVLDPPAFAKNRGALAAALRGYKEINLRALKLLTTGGILITCSCSYHLNEELFLKVLSEAARDAGRIVQIIEKRTQSRDHPILLTVPETYYLKCLVLRTLN